MLFIFVLSEPFTGINLLLKDAKGEVQGGLVATDTDRRVAHIEHLWVAEAYKGQGFGTLLLQKCEDVAKERGFVVLATDTYSYQAPIFYEKNGFRLTNTIEMPHIHCNRLYYQKEMV